MAYQETKTTGYGTRLSNSVKGIGTGFVLLIAGTVFLWRNEGRAVKTARMLEEAQGAAVHVENVATIDDSLDGQLIHATAMITTTDSLTDDTFGVGVVAVKLDRKVEYYQWVENSDTKTVDKVGGKQEEVTTYTYKQKWVNKPVNSQDFKDEAYRGKNVAYMTTESESFVAKDVKFGAYQLPENLIRSISGSEPLELSFTDAQIETWNKALNQQKKTEEIAEPSVQTTAAVADSTATDSVKVATTAVKAVTEDVVNYVHIDKNVLYLGKNQATPAIGDMRVTFTKVLPGEASVIAKVKGSSLDSYTAKNGKSLSVLTMGSVDMDQMFQNEHSSNSMWTWIFRLVGMFLVIFGLKGIFNILVTLLKVLPFLSDIVGLGVGLICNVLGFVWSLLVIAIAWLFYRPIVAGGILVVVIAGIIFLVKRGHDKKKTEVVA